jgi:peptidoglycan/LPS O-acetylase OafA/YrhL
VTAAEAEPAVTGKASARTRGAGFRPDIEGLRALAVTLVLVYHAGLPVRAGFIGVDVFFVISGFLITGLLLTELERTGRVSWLRFVGRRIRRLLPAAVLVLVVVAAVSFVVVPGLRRREIGYDVMAAATYVVNWVLARREVDYLASDASPSPVQHYWSLSVEEQFYVLWPLVLVVLVLLVRRPSRRVVGAALGGLVVASLAWSLYASHAMPRQSFFTTTTRIWELGVGALLAVWLSGRARPERPVTGAAAAGWGGLAAVVAVAVLLPTDVEWPSGWALLATLPTALVIWAGWQGPANGPARLLGTRPLVWVGGLSYSIYLWHWPAIVLGEWTMLRLTGERAPQWLPLALALGSLVPAWLSWRYLESPLHRGSWLRERPRALLAAGLGISAVGVIAALPLLPLRSPFVTEPPGGRMPPLTSLGAATVVPGQQATGTDDPTWVTPDPLVAGKDRPDADVDLCQVPAQATAPVACTFGDPDGTTTVALVGDSKAMQWLPALEEAARDRHWRIVTYGKSACAFAASSAAILGHVYPECDEWNAAVVNALRADPPDLLVTSGVADEAWDGTGAASEPLVAGYAARWRSFADEGVPVLVLGDSPVSPDELDVCAAWHPHDLDTCTFPMAPAVDKSGLPVQREAAAEAGGGVRLLDLTPWICPGGQCPVVVGHVAVHRPGDHVTATYAATLAPVVGEAADAALGR